MIIFPEFFFWKKDVLPKKNFAGKKRPLSEEKSSKGKLEAGPAQHPAPPLKRVA